MLVINTVSRGRLPLVVRGCVRTRPKQSRRDGTDKSPARECRVGLRLTIESRRDGTMRSRRAASENGFSHALVNPKGIVTPGDTRKLLTAPSPSQSFFTGFNTFPWEAVSILVRSLTLEKNPQA